MWKLIGILLMAAAVALAAEPKKPPASGVPSLVQSKTAKATVLFFITTDCPIANRYAPEIRRICLEYEKRGCAFFVVQVNKTLTEAAAAKHKSEFALPCEVVIDRKHELVKFCSAKVTPEAALLSPTGKLLYCGRIDDSYARLGQRREKPTSTDLRQALDAVLAGKPVPKARTVAIGCYIE